MSVQTKTTTDREAFVQKHNEISLQSHRYAIIGIDLRRTWKWLVWPRMAYSVSWRERKVEA